MKLVCPNSNNVTPLIKVTSEQEPKQDAPLQQQPLRVLKNEAPTHSEQVPGIEEPSEASPEENQSAESSQSTDKPKRSLAKNIIVGLMSITLLGFGGLYGLQFLQHASSHEETDDAYVTGHLHQVSTRVDGTVEQVLVDDNEHVKKGQVLVMLDPRDYKVKVDQALANLDQAERKARAAQTSVSFQDTTAQGQDTNAKGTIDNAVAAITKAQAEVREAKASIEVAQANLAAKDAELERASLDYTRYENLERQGAISTSERDSAKRDYLVALENRKSTLNSISEATARFEQAQQTVMTSKADLTKAQAQLQLAKASAVQTQVNQHQFQTDLAAVDGAKAELNEAQLNLSYTKIVAPTTGRVGKKTVEEGQRVEPGQPLLTIVADNPWVVANYKETQLKRMKPGQTVEIKVDSFPDHKFEGTILSFAPASGTSFAVLPSDNATGNFTKIVQRVPVKILFTRESIRGYEARMAPGLSVTTSVDVENASDTSLSNHRLASHRF